VRGLIATIATIGLVLLSAGPASAFVGGGRSPSQAPLIAPGQRYTGELNNHKSDANYGGYEEVALWRLPALTTHDVLTVDWHGVPFAHEPGYFPVCMYLAQGIDDFNWGGVFDDAGSCNKLSGSGTARTEIIVPATDASSYLEFFADAGETNSNNYETYPYDFSVEPILHYLAVAISPPKSLSANGVLGATANLSTGLPVPNGVTFNLSVSWNGGIAAYTAVSSGGVVNFQLALPETAWNKNARFVVTHPADGTYQTVSSSSQTIKVTTPTPTAPSPCVLAKRHARSLARQLKRLRRHAARARGRSRRVLSREARRTKGVLRKTKLEAESLCG
jgi:hypothetical protein